MEPVTKLFEYFFKQMKLIASEVCLNILRGENTIGEYNWINDKSMRSQENLKNKYLNIISRKKQNIIQKRKSIYSALQRLVLYTVCIVIII